MTEDDLAAASLNYRVLRVAGGVWVEHILPIVSWEAAEYRVIVPDSLYLMLGELGPVLRWPAAKLERLLSQRPRDMALAQDLSTILAMWRYVGKDMFTDVDGNVISEVIRYRVLSFHGGRWYAVSVGRDKSGSDNVITVISSRDSGFLLNRLRGLRDVRERGW